MPYMMEATSGSRDRGGKAQDDRNKFRIQFRHLIYVLMTCIGLYIETCWSVFGMQNLEVNIQIFQQHDVWASCVLTQLKLIDRFEKLMYFNYI